MKSFMVTVIVASEGTAKEVLEKVQAALDKSGGAGSAASCERDDWDGKTSDDAVHFEA